MPREYRSTGGPASPSPIGFGSADLNLQNPRFVAQTNAATPENVFESLQQILGLGAQVGSQLMKYKAQEIEGKISYEKAVEAKQDREAARKAAEYTADIELRIAKTASPEEAKAIRAEVLKSVSPDDTVEMRTAKARLGQAAESEARQRSTEERTAVLDNVLAVKSQADLRIQNAVAANDPDSLSALELDFLYNASVSSDPRMQSTYNELRASASEKRRALEGRSDSEDKKEQDALATAARDKTVEVLRPIVVEKAADIVGWAAELKNTTDGALERGVFDLLKSRLLEDPDMAALMEGASESEQKAISDAIRSISSPILNQVVTLRNAQQKRRSEDVAISAYAKQGASDPVAAFNALDGNFDLSAEAKNKAYAAIATSYIGSKDSSVDRLRAAEEIAATGERPAHIAANRAVAAEMKTVSATVALERDSLVKASKEDENPLTFGWTSKYGSRNEFLTDVLQRHLGTSIDGLGSSPLSIQQYAAQLAGQWDEDQRRTFANIKRQETELLRTNAEERKKMSVAGSWDGSPLAKLLSTGNHSKMKVEELVPVVDDSLFGFADSILPPDAKKVIITEFDNPANFSMVAAYWKVAGGSMNPQARNEVLGSPEALKSWAVGTYLNMLGPEVDPQTTSSMVQALAANLSAGVSPAGMDGGAKTKLTEQREKAFALLAGGAGLDTGVFDFYGAEPGDAMKSMQPADMATFMTYAALAAAAPNTADSGRLMAQFMKQDNWAVYAVPDEDNGTVFRLVQNRPGVEKTTPLPSPEVMESNEWRAYVLSHRKQIADGLQKIPMLNGEAPPSGTYTPETIEDIQVSIHDQEVKQGYVVVKAKVSGVWRNIPSSVVKLSNDDFIKNRATRKAAFAQTMSEAFEERGNPWLPGSF